MARKRIWAHFPVRFFDEERYHKLTHEACVILHRLYIVCDRWGRFLCGGMTLVSTVRWSDLWELDQHFDELVDEGFVERFTSTEGLECGQLVDYDTYAPSEMIRKRGASIYDPIEDGRADAGVTPPECRTSAGDSPAKGRQRSGNGPSVDGQTPVDSPPSAAPSPSASLTRERQEGRGESSDPPMSDPRPTSEPSRARGDADTHTVSRRQTRITVGGVTYPPTPEQKAEIGRQVREALGEGGEREGGQEPAQPATKPPDPGERQEVQEQHRSAGGAGATPPPSLGNHTDGSDRVYPDLGPAALRWLQHRAEVSKRHGYQFATIGEAEDLQGAQLRRMQEKPGFDDCVDKMLRLDDARWGKSLRGGVAYLARMVHDWIKPSKGNGKPPNRQAHLIGETLSVAEYKARTGIDPTKAPIADDETARQVAEAIGAPA